MRIELSFMVLVLAGCDGDDAGVPAACDIALTDANNYTFSGALAVPSIATASATDLHICWDDLTADFQCHAMDPAADIDNVGLVRFGALTQAEVNEGLSTNSLQQSEMSGYVQAENDGGTCVDLSSMSFFGTPFELETEYVEGGGTYMLMMTSGTTPGVGARMITFLEPSAASDVTDVNVGTGCGLLDFTINLHALETTPVCGGGPWTVDWSALTRDGQGGSMDASQVDSVMIGYYAGATVGDLEADFLDLEENATALWSVEVPGGTTADLSAAANDAGAFPGFSGEGLWILALRCSRCYNPAPVFLTVLVPEEE